MKKLIFGLVATLLITLNANAQRPSLSSAPCEVGEHAVLVYEFSCMKLHRASTGCQKRFSICTIGGKWKVECRSDSQSKLSSYIGERDAALIVAEISEEGNTAILHFPIELKNLSHFTADDFKNFGLDENYSLNTDFVIASGEYIPNFTNDEILVKVNLK